MESPVPLVYGFSVMSPTEKSREFICKITSCARPFSAWKTGKKMVQFAALVLVACVSDENGKDYFVSSRNVS